MASTIVATAGGASSNSYVTLAEAITYFGDRLQDDLWNNAGSGDRTAALLWAARILDTRVSWNGNKTATTQAMAWPRANVVDIEQPDSWSTSYLDDATIPQFLQDAQCEVALALLGSDTTLDPDSIGLASLAVGSLNIQFDASRKPAVLPRAARDLIAGYGSIRSGSGMVKLVRA